MTDELPARVADRYHRVAPLGQGGMGTVWRVWDDHLRRHVALKLLRSELGTDSALARFAEEARIAAALQHPGIVPVHDLGALPDGRPWFTMNEVEGVGLDQRNAAVHAAWRTGRSGLAGDGAFRRLLEVFLRVCETVAYAHDRGVVHRDLKPANVMIGPYGAVYVLDWGLARLGPVGSGAGTGHPRLTRIGAVTGTPAYLSPEQARGASAEAGPRSDVYALGATLYELLCERPPRIARTPDQLIAAIAAGTSIVPPSERADGAPADPELDRICVVALSTDPAGRYPGAGAMATDVAAWLDGAPRRARAAELVAEADASITSARAAAEAAVRRADAAAKKLAALPPHATAEAKRDAWADTARATEAEAEARAERTRAIHTLRAALSHVPDWPDAHAQLAELFHERHLALERARRPLDAEAVAADLRQHDRTGRFARYLDGAGTLTLHTTVPVEVMLHRWVVQDQRLVSERVRTLGTTPLDAIPLPMGSWVLTLHRPGHHVVTYPVWLGRCDDWSGVRPGDHDAHPVWIPPEGTLDPGEVYVPAGWFWSGEDVFEHTLPLRRMWVDGFALDRFPVTVGRYVRYLNQLVDAGNEAAALAAMPHLGDAAEPMFARDGSGRFIGIRRDRTGAGWDLLPTDPATPVTNVDWHQAVGYAAAHDRRLPIELEWQKAARGADLRAYPWGDPFDPSWCRMGMSAPQSMIVPVTDYPTDVSVYGARGMAGNVSDWVSDGIPGLPEQLETDIALVRVWDAPQRLITGGSCGAGPRTCEVTQRSRISAMSRGLRVGFRTARTIG